jgi:hypothetical protein
VVLSKLSLSKNCQLFVLCGLSVPYTKSIRPNENET